MGVASYLPVSNATVSALLIFTIPRTKKNDR